MLPVTFDGNVFTKGTVRPVTGKLQERFGEMSTEAKEAFKKMQLRMHGR